MFEFKIFEAGLGDLDRIEPLWLSMHAHHRDNPPDRLLEEIPFRDETESWQYRRQHYRHWLTEEPEARLFLAVDPQDHAVGYAFARVNPEQASMVTGRIGVLESFAVMPDQRGAGLGTALVGAMIDHFRSLGLRQWSLEVMVGNDRAQRFYEGLGLRPYVIGMLGRIPD